MSEKEAWLYLAEKWANAKPSMAHGYLADAAWGMICCGLCLSISDLARAGLISGDVEAAMEAKVEAHKVQTGCEHLAYIWPRTVWGAIHRTEFCKTQAERL